MSATPRHPDKLFFLLIFSASPFLSNCSPAWQCNTLRLPPSPPSSKTPLSSSCQRSMGAIFIRPLPPCEIHSVQKACEHPVPRARLQVWTEPIVAGESVPSVSCFRMLAFIRKFLREVSCYCLASVDDDCCVIVRCVEHAQHKVLRKKNKHAQTKHLFVPISVMWEDWNWRIVCLMFYRNVSQKKKRLFKEFSDL